MSRTRALVFALLGLAAHLLLVTGAGAAAPAEWRLVLAFVALVLLPGHALRIAAGARTPGGVALSSGWALGLGVMWNGIAVLVTRALGVPFTALAIGLIVPNALLWVLAALRGAPAAAPEAPRLSRAALAWIVLAAALAAWHCARLGTPITYYSDSPDHIGTIRRMLASGDAFPNDAFFRNAGALGADPRKGLWHSIVALLFRLAAVDPIDGWRMMPALLAPLFALNAAALGMLLGGGAGAAVGAWALVLTYGGSLGAPFLREAVFATKLADQLAIATAVAVLTDLERGRNSQRLAAMGLALGAVFAHVFAAIQFAVVFGALGVLLLIRDRGFRPPLRRLVATTLALGATCLPYLAWRALQSYAPRNIIHLEPQGLLTLWDHVRMVSIGVLWDWQRWLWLLFPFAWWSLWKDGRERPAALYVLGASLAVAVLLFAPPAVALLHPRLGYLLMRLIWAVPLFGLLAWLLPRLARALVRERGPARLRAALASVAVLVLAAPTLEDGVHALTRPGEIAHEESVHSPLRWRSALGWMAAKLPPGEVVLADPATSYAVPMLTPHYVMTLVDQHSSPNDSLALTRILEARDALDPYADWQTTRRILKRWGVSVIVLNGDFAEVPKLDYWTPNPAWYAAARARLDRSPATFERLYDHDRFTVYRVHEAALDTLGGGPAARPFVRTWQEGAYPVGRVIDQNLPALLGFGFDHWSAAPGDTLRGTVEWRALRAMPAGSYVVSVRFDRDLPAGFRPPAWVSKPARKLLERGRHERYRFRADHLPLGGAYGVDLWGPGEVVSDSFMLTVPRDVADGTYRVQVRLLREPHYPNFRLSDYFFDTDYYTGLPVGSLEIERVAAAPR